MNSSCKIPSADHRGDSGTARRVPVWISRITLVAIILFSTSAAQLQARDTVFNLEDYQGKVVYVDFWASWCTPCRASFPFMNDIQRQFGDDLVVAAINLDEDREAAESFLSEFDVIFDIHYDPSAKLAQDYGLKGMPTSYLFGRNGEPLGSHVGFRKKDEKKLRAAIAAAISQSAHP